MSKRMTSGAELSLKINKERPGRVLHQRPLAQVNPWEGYKTPLSAVGLFCLPVVGLSLTGVNSLRVGGIHQAQNLSISDYSVLRFETSLSPAPAPAPPPFLMVNSTIPPGSCHAEKIYI